MTDEDAKDMHSLAVGATPHPEDIEANLALAKKEAIELQLVWLAAACDAQDKNGDGMVTTRFVRNRIAAIRESL